MRVLEVWLRFDRLQLEHLVCTILAGAISAASLMQCGKFSPSSCSSAGADSYTRTSRRWRALRSVSKPVAQELNAEEPLTKETDMQHADQPQMQDDKAEWFVQSMTGDFWKDLDVRNPGAGGRCNVVNLGMRLITHSRYRVLVSRSHPLALRAGPGRDSSS